MVKCTLSSITGSTLNQTDTDRQTDRQIDRHNYRQTDRSIFYWHKEIHYRLICHKKKSLCELDSTQTWIQGLCYVIDPYKNAAPTNQDTWYVTMATPGRRRHLVWFHCIIFHIMFQAFLHLHVLVVTVRRISLSAHSTLSAAVISISIYGYITLIFCAKRWNTSLVKEKGVRLKAHTYGRVLYYIALKWTPFAYLIVIRLRTKISRIIFLTIWDIILRCFIKSSYDQISIHLKANKMSGKRWAAAGGGGLLLIWFVFTIW